MLHPQQLLSLVAVVVVVGILVLPAGRGVRVVRPIDGSFLGFEVKPGLTRAAALSRAESTFNGLFGSESSHGLYADTFCTEVVAGAVAHSVHLVSLPFFSSMDAEAFEASGSMDLFGRTFITGDDGIFEDLLFCTLSSLEGDLDWFRFASSATLAVSYLLPKDLPPKITGCPGPPVTASTDLRSWSCLMDRHDAANRLLARALGDPLALASSTGMAPLSPLEVSYLQDWGDQVGVSSSPQILDVPSELHGLGASFANAAYASLPFSHRSGPTSTEPLLPVDPQPSPPAGFVPRSVEDLLLPLPLELVRAWLRLQVANMKLVRVLGPNVDLSGRNTLELPVDVLPEVSERSYTLVDGVLVIGQEGFRPQARGIVWDLRPLATGDPIVPLKFTAPPRSDLDMTSFEREFGHELDPDRYPDRELLSFLQQGARFKADMELAIVLGPQLVSLGDTLDSFTSVESELIRLAELKYQSIHPFLPFLPLRVVPQGSTPRKYEPARRRRTSNHSFPHFERLKGLIFDALGFSQVVQSLNKLVDLKAQIEGVDCNCVGYQRCQRCRKWAPEIKPRMEDKLYDDTILSHAAGIWGEQLFMATDDFADYFNQFPTSPSEYWKSTLLWLPLRGVQHPELGFSAVAEYRLGFGCSASSSICQRLTDFLLFVFRRRFDAEEESLFILETDAKRLRWLQRRRVLSQRTGRNECRLYSAHGYTDDIVFSVVGHGRFARALRCWRRLMIDFNIVMAIARKRQAGVAVTWLGVDFYAVGGFTVLPNDKRLRALGLASEFLDSGSMIFSRFRSLAGMLESYRPVVGFAAADMYGLYDHQFRRGVRHPALPITATDKLREVLGAWRVRLLQQAGSFFTLAIPNGLVWTPSVPGEFCLYSDAAGEGRAPGLGGYAHGSFWYIPLTCRHRNMPMVALEFVALVVNVMIFGPRLVGARVRLFSDSLATVQVLNRKARSAITMFIHKRFLDLDITGRLLPGLSVHHVFGAGNVMSDAVSRMYLDVLHGLASQIGVSLAQVDVPQAALNFLEEVLSEFERGTGVFSP